MTEGRAASGKEGPRSGLCRMDRRLPGRGGQRTSCSPLLACLFSETLCLSSSAVSQARQSEEPVSLLFLISKASQTSALSKCSKLVRNTDTGLRRWLRG